jgi:hypothetical protein
LQPPLGALPNSDQLTFNPGFPYMNPAPVETGLESDDMIPVASVYPASVNERHLVYVRNFDEMMS